MKTINLDNIKPLKINVKKEFDFPKLKNMPPNSDDLPFFNATLIGARGMGKSYLMLEMLENYKKIYNKFYVISPTRKTDQKVKIFFENLEEEDDKKIVYFDELNEKNLKDVLDDLKEDIEYWRKYMKIKMLVDKVKKDGSKGLNDKEMDELMELLMFEDEEDIKLSDLETLTNAFEDFIKNDYPPLSMLIIDDSYGCKLLTKNQGSNPFIQYFIKHRHYLCSNMLLVQSISGIPRAIRSNTTIFLAFSVKSIKDRDILYQEVDNIFPNKKDFIDLMNQSDREQFGFIFLDLTSTKDPDIRIGLRKKVELD